MPLIKMCKAKQEPVLDLLSSLVEPQQRKDTLRMKTHIAGE